MHTCFKVIVLYNVTCHEGWQDLHRLTWYTQRSARTSRGKRVSGVLLKYWWFDMNRSSSRQGTRLHQGASSCATSTARERPRSSWVRQRWSTPAPWCPPCRASHCQQPWRWPAWGPTQGTHHHPSRAQAPIRPVRGNTLGTRGTLMCRDAHPRWHSVYPSRSWALGGCPSTCWGRGHTCPRSCAPSTVEVRTLGASLPQRPRASKGCTGAASLAPEHSPLTAIAQGLSRISQGPGSSSWCFCRRWSRGRPRTPLSRTRCGRSRPRGTQNAGLAWAAPSATGFAVGCISNSLCTGERSPSQHPSLSFTSKKNVLRGS